MQKPHWKTVVGRAVDDGGEDGVVVVFVVVVDGEDDVAAADDVVVVVDVGVEDYSCGVGIELDYLVVKDRVCPLIEKTCAPRVIPG